MSARIRWFFTALYEAFTEWRRDNSPLVAGGLSFFALFSLVPLAIITLSVFGRLFAGTSSMGLVIAAMGEIFSPEAAQSAAVMMTRAEITGGSANLASGVVLLWAGSRVFMQLQRALSDVWHIPAADLTRLEKFLRFLINRFRGLVATFGLGIATVLYLTMDVAVGAFGHFLHDVLPGNWSYGVLPWITVGSSLVLFTLLFAMIYRWLPNEHPGWAAVWSGALAASGLFCGARLLLSLYLRVFNVMSFLGAAGSIMVILIWVYTSMQILLFGARFAWIIGRRHLERD